MTETHEVSARHEDSVRRILTEIAGGCTSQRMLAQKVGIALGLTNLLVRRLVARGWVRIIRMKRNRVEYVITPAGLIEQTRMSQHFLASSVRSYADARDRVIDRFAELSAGWPHAADEKRIVFYGADEVAEIGYVCLQSTDLRLVGVVDHGSRGQFFGLPVHRPADLRPGSLAGVPFDRLVVMSFGTPEAIRQQLDSLSYPTDLVFCV